MSAKASKTKQSEPHTKASHAADISRDYDGFRAALLQWYDAHQRTLPWRSLAREHPRGDLRAYYVWLSEIMLQQTTVPAVMPYFLRFIDAWPDVNALAGADEDSIMQAWAGLGYYSRARNLHRCARMVAHDLGGRFPDTEEGLLTLPGVGPYTAAAIASIAFDRPATVIDGNVDRIIVRLHALRDPIRVVKPDIRRLAVPYFIRPEDDSRAGDFAQAMMDLGATICTPKKPACALCPVRASCSAAALGIAAELPAPPATKIRPMRAAIAYVITDEAGRVMIEKRPEKGLLAGTYGLPCTPWRDIDRRPAAAAIRHVFTHFELYLDIAYAKAGDLPAGLAADMNILWATREDISAMGFPSLFQKALNFAKL